MVEQPSPSAPFGSQVFMMNGAAPISITTQSKDYSRSCQEAGKEVDGPYPSLASSPLEIERLSAEFIIRPPSKGVLQNSSYNTNTYAAQHYNIVDDLAQVPSTMSVLEVLQIFLSQQKALLSTIGRIDPADSSLTFDTEDFIP